MINVCVAGATGWVGAPLCRAVVAAHDLQLVSAVSRSAAGGSLAEAPGVPVHAAVPDALEGVDVLIDYTSHEVVLDNTLAALDGGAHVVIGSSGLSGEDLERIDELARAKNLGVIAAGNFSITAAMAQAAALLVAPHLPQAEILDYSSSTKRDAPSGTAREMAERLSQVRAPQHDVPPADTDGSPEARGASVEGTQVHSLRLPSFSVSTEVLFGLPHERLSIRHDADDSYEPYIEGTLLATRKVIDRVGLTRGLDTLLLDR